MLKKYFPIVVLCIFTFSSCLTGFSDFYEPWFEYDYFTEESYLQEDETPEVIQTSELDIKFREISSMWYWCIGSARFNGEDRNEETLTEDLIGLCKDKKAKLAIWAKEYTDTKSGSYSIPHTNYHSYTNSFGYTSSYATTSYSTHFFSMQRFNFSSYLFISIPTEYKKFYTPGFSISDLSEKDRETYKQNTGCLINVVYKDTTAYYANLFHGDIITKVNDIKIYSVEDFRDFCKKSTNGDKWKLTLIRNGSEKEINLVYDLFQADPN